MKVTIQKIAEMCGVSIMTVSRVFDPAKASMVKEATRRKILAAAKQYNYHPVMIGRSFVTGKTYKVGLILDSMSKDLRSPTYGRFITAVCDELQKYNYTLSLLLAKDSKGRHGENIRELLESKVADGYLLGKSMFYESMNASLKKAPVLLLSQQEDGDSTPDDCTQIRLSFLDALRQMWLMIPQEYRQKVIVIAPDCQQSRNRVELIRQAAPQGAELEILLVDTIPDFLLDREASRNAVEENFEKLRQFKVIWGISDLYALGAADVFRRHGLVPGKDVFFIGIDNLEADLPVTEAFLTTIDLHWDQKGRQASRAILKMIAGEPVPEEELVVIPEIVRRNSL